MKGKNAVSSQYQRGPISSVYTLQDDVSYMKKGLDQDNEGLRAQIHAQG